MVSRPLILQFTNHGIHDWEVRSGLQDTGGQNHYVNALTDTLVDLGFQVTIGNRGGFPDPVTGRVRDGVVTKGDHARIVYLHGGGSVFIRKEELTEATLDAEAEDAATRYGATWQRPATAPVLIISHYWDGALLAERLRRRLCLAAPHLWIPHSLGALKQANFRGRPAEVVAACRFETRIAQERAVLPAIDAIASTSGDIGRVLHTAYGRTPDLFLPPCIDTAVVHPLTPNQGARIYDFLAAEDPRTGPHVWGRPCVLEVSRTDQTKRKDLLIQAFAAAATAHPEAMLLLTLSRDNARLHAELMQLIDALGIRDRVVCLGIIPRELIAELYGICTVYCSPSEMEGFGMSVQEACACARATVSSHLIPFAVEYLAARTDRPAGGLVVKAGDVGGFAQALATLLADAPTRERIAATGYATTIPHFTWDRMTRHLLRDLGLTPPCDVA